ncbi:hypothetical protein [Gordonia sp. CPCC 205333]|uniref:hypothetical protein n=1 Tax=Gordonia sp. CPCC 205333 TaxID=3140790 RepID=UPI003AF3F949
MASVIVNILSRADNSGIAKASRAVSKLTAVTAAAAPAAAGAAQAVAAIGIAGASAAALALPALGAIMAGADGVKRAASTITPEVTSFKSAMSSALSGTVPGFAKLGGVLTAITPQMSGVGKAVATVFNGAASAVARNTTGIQALATKSAEFVTRLGPGLNLLIDKAIAFGAAINVDSIFAVFQTLGSALGPVIDLVTQLAGAAGPLGSGFAIFGQIITGITPALVQVATVLGPVIAQSMTSLTPAIGQVAAAFASVVTAIAPVLPVVASLTAGLVSGLGPVLPVIVAALLAISPVIKVISAAMKVWTVVQWALNSALLANPITWIVLAVIALIAVIVLIATKTTWFQTIWQTMCAAAVIAWNWIKTAAIAVWNAIVAAVMFAVNLIRTIVSAVVAAIVSYWNLALAGASAVWRGISAVVSTVAGVIRAVISGAINGAIAAFNRAKSVASSVFSAIGSVIDTVANAISTVVGWVQNLISAISNISWPSPPGWLSGLFGGFEPMVAMPGESAFMTPTWAVHNPRTLQLASGAPSLADLGGLGGRGTTVYVDNSISVQVDGSGIVDVNKVARAVEDVLTRHRRTIGARPAVVFG